MHRDASTLDSESLVEGDLCIVGAGAAGIAIALEWANESRTVVLLEGGGFDLEPEVQDLYRGEIIGRAYYPMDAARLHYFGGTTGHWAGFCSPLDSIDFMERPWVPESGWPFAREELDAYYGRAHEVLELGPYGRDAAFPSRLGRNSPLPLDSRIVWTKPWQFSPPTRFGRKYREPICQATNIHLYTHANVTEILLNESQREVEELRVRTLGQLELRVRARKYVLACCAIQNARVLLSSQRQKSDGIGNDRGLVGRFFMEHLEMPIGELAVVPAMSRAMDLYSYEYGQTKARGELALTPAVQTAAHLYNATVSLGPVDSADEEAESTFEAHPPAELEAIRLRSDDTGPQHSVARTRKSTTRFQLTVRQEQSPNALSRVRLSARRDALGMPRTSLDWQLTEFDKHSMRRSALLLAEAVGRSGIGRMRLNDWLLTDEPMWPASVSGAWHHMGTTRMHVDRTKGVVDANCRVHGLQNLYVAGSSVFPTAGAANPTLTIVAMSLRLSDHLKSANS
jgi:choline dehydrogenase-like flavoprotein